MPGSTSVGFSIDAAVMVDAFVLANEYQKGEVRYTLVMNVTAGPSETWTLDLNENLLGLLGIRDDFDIGTGANSNAGVTNTTVIVDGNPVSFTSAGSLTNNDNSVSQQFSGSRNQLAALSGTGNDTFNVTIAFDIDAFSKSGCSGFLCTGNPDEAAVLAGLNDISGDLTADADEYGDLGAQRRSRRLQRDLHAQREWRPRLRQRHARGRRAVRRQQHHQRGRLLGDLHDRIRVRQWHARGRRAVRRQQQRERRRLLGRSARSKFAPPSVPSGSRAVWLALSFALLAIGAALLGRRAGRSA